MHRNGEITFRKLQKSTSMSRLSADDQIRKTKSFKDKRRRESVDYLNKTWEGCYKKKKPSQTKEHSINATIIKIEEAVATLLTDEYEIFQIPLCLLPSHITISNIITIELEIDQEAQRKRDKAIIELQEKIQNIYNNAAK